MNPGLLEAPHLQPLLEEVEGVRDGFADQSGPGAAQQAPQVTFTEGGRESSNDLESPSTKPYMRWVSGALTSGLCGCWRRSQQPFEDVVGEELQPSVRKYGEQRRGKTAVKGPRSLRAAHRRHGVSQVNVRLRRQAEQKAEDMSESAAIF